MLVYPVPFGSVGSHFVTELTKLYESYCSTSAMESLALKAAMVLPALLLQKPHRQLKSHEHIKCLEHHLHHWREGDITTLLEEGLIIQQHLKHSRHIASTDSSRVATYLLPWYFMAKSRLLCVFSQSNLGDLFCPCLYQLGVYCL